LTSWPLAHLGEVVRRPSTWNPATNGSFVYIDLSAVNQEIKKIMGARHMAGKDAPSRARQLVAAGDVLVSTVRPNLNSVARVQLELDGATASTGFCVLRPRDGLLDPDYLFHWVRTRQFVASMTERASGASYPAVSDRIVLDSSIPLPPLDEQRRIAEVLDRADGLRANRRATLALLDTLIQSIFLEMFGDPVINPQGLPEVVLGDVITSVSDGPHVSPTYIDAGVPFLSTRHVRAGEITWSDIKYLSLADAEVQWKKCKPHRDDILYTKGGTTGLAAVVRTDDPFAVWVHLAVVRPDRTKVEPIWLESMLNSPFCYAQSQRFTHGIANRDLGLTRMVNIKMILPPLDHQRTFVNRRSVIDALLEKQKTSLTSLDALFASIQHRAFRGEL
jgi:type I restriction enzyme, S subunit